MQIRSRKKRALLFCLDCIWSYSEWIQFPIIWFQYSKKFVYQIFVENRFLILMNPLKLFGKHVKICILNKTCEDGKNNKGVSCWRKFEVEEYITIIRERKGGRNYVKPNAIYRKSLEAFPNFSECCGT